MVETRGYRSKRARIAAVAVMGALALLLFLVSPAPAPPPEPPWLVTVKKTGTGDGTIDGLNSSGATAPGNFATDLTDIHCGSQCVFQVPFTLSLSFTHKLRATAKPGSHLAAWVGCSSFNLTTGECLVINATTATVTAIFTRDVLADQAVWHVQPRSGVATGVPWGSGPLGDVPVPADYDGDGRADLAVWRPETGEWFIVRSSDGGVLATPWGSGALGDVPVPADYDGDGKADLAVWRPGEPTVCGSSRLRYCSQGTWYIRRSSDGATMTVDWGSGILGDVPVPRDYDGDGKADLAVWRPDRHGDPSEEGVWHLIQSSNGRPISQQWGSSVLHDVPVPADYDGDGRADFAVWRPATGEWFIIASSSGAVTQRQWGAPDDIPVPHDYDGDGRADIAIWRPGTGEWFIVNSSNGSVTTRGWGAPGDIPVPAPLTGGIGADLTVYRP